MRHEKSQIKDELIAHNKVRIPILLAKQYKKETTGIMSQLQVMLRIETAFCIYRNTAPNIH